MKSLAVSVLYACLCVGLVLADSPKARFSPKAPFNDPTDLATIKQIEREMGDAIVAVDIEKLNQIYADDFAMIGSSGKILTKDHRQALFQMDEGAAGQARQPCDCDVD
jgi:hypothetical protein